MRAMEKLKAAIDNAQSCACIGIDPVLERIPDQIQADSDMSRMRDFCFGVLDQVAGKAGIVKPQSACFERYGSEGYAILEQVINRAKDLDLVVILDSKRGDIGSSAQHYAQGARSMGADIITLSPYMGRSTIQPFLDAGLGVFGLCRTSNPDADELQCLESGGNLLCHHVGNMLASLDEQSAGQVGAVIGATNSPKEVQLLRDAMPSSMFLVPGVGAQGGSISDVQPMCRPHAKMHSELGVVINASRSVLYPESLAGENWEEAIGREAVAFASECASLLID
ncbi:MAG: orotidine-5'-phosphate decarboxylase [Phycisphaerales bacterium]